MGALAEERCNGEGGLVNLPKVGPPTFSACDGWMTTRFGAAAGSLASSDGHNSEQPASRKPHAKGKTNLYIFSYSADTLLIHYCVCRLYYCKYTPFFFNLVNENRAVHKESGQYTKYPTYTT